MPGKCALMLCERAYSAPWARAKGWARRLTVEVSTSVHGHIWRNMSLPPRGFLGRTRGYNGDASSIEFF